MISIQCGTSVLMEALYMETFKVRLDQALSTWSFLSLFATGELDQVAFKSPFQLTCFYDLLETKQCHAL